MKCEEIVLYLHSDWSHFCLKGCMPISMYHSGLGSICCHFADSRRAPIPFPAVIITWPWEWKSEGRASGVQQGWKDRRGGRLAPALRVLCGRGGGAVQHSRSGVLLEHVLVQLAGAPSPPGTW